MIEVDDRDWPIVVTRWPDGEMTDEDIEAFLATGLTLVHRGRHWNLHLAKSAPSLNARQRARMAAHVKEHRELLATNVAGAAVVVDSAIARGVVTAVNWLAPPPFPQEVFATRAEADAWLARENARERATGRR